MTVFRQKALVFDSWAVLAYLQGEPASECMSSMIAEALERENPLYISVVNAGEIWYIMARKLSSNDADTAIGDMKGWGVQIVDVDWEITLSAAHFKSIHKMSYADAFAAALAKSKKAGLVTGDSEFKAVASEIKVVWLNG